MHRHHPSMYVIVQSSLGYFKILTDVTFFPTTSTLFGFADVLHANFCVVPWLQSSFFGLVHRLTLLLRCYISEKR